MRKSIKLGVAVAGLLLVGTPAAASADMTGIGNIGIDSGMSAISFQGFNLCHDQGHEAAWYGGDIFNSFEVGNIGIVDGIYYSDTSSACLGGHGHDGHDGHHGNCWNGDRDEAARLNNATESKMRPATRCSSR